MDSGFYFFVTHFWPVPILGIGLIIFAVICTKDLVGGLVATFIMLGVLGCTYFGLYYQSSEDIDFHKQAKINKEACKAKNGVPTWDSRTHEFFCLSKIPLDKP